ncbi:MAG: EEP domain-containing protein, partial [Pseudaminobacter sp.]|nr:EEP domain-containing protein [Pseudaminobacter sp.]
GAIYRDGLTDAALIAGHRADGLHTHVKEIDGRIRKRRLDHCFVGSMLASRVRSVSADNAEIASDHHPLWIDIDLETPGVA